MKSFINITLALLLSCGVYAQAIAQTPQLTQPAVTAAPAPAPTAQPETKQKVAIDDKLIVVATGAVTGVYYPAGGAICRLVNKERKLFGIRCTTEATAGSIDNIDQLRSADVDLGIVQSDWQEHAYNGTGLFAPKGRFEKLRFLFSLHKEAMTVIVKRGSKINKFDDLKGKIVNLGVVGSGVRATMDDLLKAKGWTLKTFKSVTELKPTDQPRALCSGMIDAMVLATGHPNGLIQDATSLCETDIIPVNDEVVQRFVAGNPELSMTTIPAGLYPGIPDEIETFGVIANVMTTSELSDEIAYNATKAVFDNIEIFKTLHPVFSTLTPAHMAKDGKVAPYHPGALRYYKEKNIQVSE